MRIKLTRMDFKDFPHLTPLEDKENPLVLLFRNEEGDLLYLEPGFLYALEGMKEKRGADYPRILLRIEEELRSEHRLILTGNYETPFFSKEGFVYREITDITDPLGILVEDKSRGSDYGD